MELIGATCSSGESVSSLSLFSQLQLLQKLCQMSARSQTMPSHCHGNHVNKVVLMAMWSRLMMALLVAKRTTFWKCTEEVIWSALFLVSSSTRHTEQGLRGSTRLVKVCRVMRSTSQHLMVSKHISRISLFNAINKGLLYIKVTVMMPLLSYGHSHLHHHQHHHQNHLCQESFFIITISSAH